MALLPQPPPLHLPNPTASRELNTGNNWFKVVVTKCPSGMLPSKYTSHPCVATRSILSSLYCIWTGNHEGTAAVTLDRSDTLWHTLPDTFVQSAMAATSRVPIQDLIIKCHRLTSLPASLAVFSSLGSSLKTLDISHNCLKSVTPGLGELSVLQELNLSHNKLESLAGAKLHQLSKLRVLNVQSNQLEGLPDNLCRLEMLRLLNLESNKISILPVNIGQLVNLRELLLKSNHIVTLPDTITDLPKLEILHVSDNALHTLPVNLLGLCSLKQLYLAGNQLQYLPKSLAELPSLTGLTISGNPLLSPPLAVCKRGLAAINNYFRRERYRNDVSNFQEQANTHLMYTKAQM